MCRLLASVTVSLIFWLVAASPAGAEGVAACPRTGTIVKATDSLGDYITTFRGTDSADSSICISVTERPGVALNSAREQRTIYGWFNLSTRTTYAPDQRQIVRDALAAVLNGTETATTFDLTVNRRGTNVLGTSTSTLSRLGQASLTIEGRTISAITLRFAAKGLTNSLYSQTYYDIYWDVWYDPSSHLFVKGHLTDRRGGGARVRDFEVTSITLPQ
jgi:hypothetical protein